MLHRVRRDLLAVALPLTYFSILLRVNEPESCSIETGLLANVLGGRYSSSSSQSLWTAIPT